MLNVIKKFYHKYHGPEFRQAPILWLYAAYSTLRYIDAYQHFPAIKFTKFIRIKFHKDKTSIIKINQRLIFEPFLNANQRTIFTLQKNSIINVENDFVFGSGIRVFLGEGAELILKGKLLESGSGITADSVVMVRKKIEIGYDCIIAWNTFITDSDWHSYGDREQSLFTKIGNHVWIGVGAKVLKGANIGKNSIITSNSTVLNGEYPVQVMLSGNPAKIKKENIDNWIR